MYLADREIHELLDAGQLIIRSPIQELPFEPEKQIQPGSIDLHIGNNFLRFREEVDHLDLATDTTSMSSLVDRIELTRGQSIVIQPEEVLICSTLEWIKLPDDIAGSIVTRGRVARIGLSVECTDYVNPGSSGVISLQLINHNRFPVTLYPFMSLCQLVLIYMSSTPQVSRSARHDASYQFEKGPTMSVINLDSEVNRIVTGSQLDLQNGNVREQIRRTVQQLLERNIEELVTYLRSKRKELDDEENLRAVLGRYQISNSQSSSARRLRIIFWFTSIIFMGSVGWLLTSLAPILRNEVALLDAAIPIVVAVYSLVIMIVTFNGELF